MGTGQAGRTSYACCSAANRFVAFSWSSMFLSGWCFNASRLKERYSDGLSIKCQFRSSLSVTVLQPSYLDFVWCGVFAHFKQSVVIFHRRLVIFLLRSRLTSAHSEMGIGTNRKKRGESYLNLSRRKSSLRDHSDFSHVSTPSCRISRVRVRVLFAKWPAGLENLNHHGRFLQVIDNLTTSISRRYVFAL